MRAELESPIRAAEKWLVKEARGLVDCKFRSVEAGPGEWSEEYLRRVIALAPAVRVAWLGGQARDAALLTLDTRWVVYVLTAWDGNQTGDHARVGAYAACTLLATKFHNVLIPSTGRVPSPGRVRVGMIDNLWSAEVEKKGLALYAIGLEVPIPLDLEIDPSDYGDFLRAGLDWDIPDQGEDVDVRRVVQVRGGNDG